MAKKKKGKRGRPRSQNLQKCPRCGKPGFIVEKRAKRPNGRTYVYNYCAHYSTAKYKSVQRQGAHLLGDPMNWCYLPKKAIQEVAAS